MTVEALVVQSPAPCWVLGLPIDCLTEEEARVRILAAAHNRTRLVFATPNLDFLVEANKDAAFRDAILDCDLSLADGMPVVWLGRMVGAPVPMRVAGSSLLDALIEDPGERGLRIFFFGGNKGMARAASEALDAKGGKATSAGWLDPGFVSVDEMSTPETIARINGSRADFLVVALGARKGHAWIAKNAPHLDIPVISHLGAAIGFVAGLTKRAPRLVQLAGMEWAWRMVMEPRLVHRYSRDFMFLLRALLRSVLPIMTGRIRAANRSDISITKVDGRLVISGALMASTLRELEMIVAEKLEELVCIDLSAVTAADSRSLGYLYDLVWRKGRRKMTVRIDDGSPLLPILRAHSAKCLG